MTQQPYYPPQQGYPPQQPPPQQPPSGYPPQYPQAPQQPPPGYPPQQPYAQPGYPPQQGYGQPYGQQAPQQQPQQPLVQGSLDDFYNQPATGGGKGISWSEPNGNQRPVGTTFIGTVARDVTKGDVSQITNREGVPQFFRDGRAKFQMRIPLKQVALFDPQGNQLPLPVEFTDGEATWYVKGQGKEELVRAMAEAQANGDPAGGDVISITLVNRRANGGGMNPSNIVQVRYQGRGTAGQGAPAQEAPAPQAPQQQQQAPAGPAPQPVQQPAAQEQPQYAPPTGYGPPQGVPQPVQQPQYAPQAQPQQPAQQYAPPAAAVPQQQAPQPQQVPGQGQPMWQDPEQAALFARITGQPQQQGAPAA